MNLALLAVVIEPLQGKDTALQQLARTSTRRQPPRSHPMGARLPSCFDRLSRAYLISGLEVVAGLQECLLLPVRRVF